MRKPRKNSWYFFPRLRRRQLTKNTCCNRGTEERSRDLLPRIHGLLWQRLWNVLVQLQSSAIRIEHVDVLDVGAWRHRHRLADGTGRVTSGRCEAGLPQPSDRGIEVAGEQMEVRQSGREVGSPRLHLE